jgi:hypothetical protein
LSEAASPVIVIEWLGDNCPVQAEGTINSHPFYFRARGSHWSLEIATGLNGPRDYLKWGDVSNYRYEEPYGNGSYDAGWMSEDEARQFIAKGALAWVNDKTGDAA